MPIPPARVLKYASKTFVKRSGIDPLSIIDHAELNIAGNGLSGLDKHHRLKRLRRGERIERVADQIDQHLLDLTGSPTAWANQVPGRE